MIYFSLNGESNDTDTTVVSTEAEDEMQGKDVSLLLKPFLGEAYEKYKKSIRLSHEQLVIIIYKLLT